MHSDLTYPHDLESKTRMGDWQDAGTSKIFKKFATWAESDSKNHIFGKEYFRIATV